MRWIRTLCGIVAAVSVAAPAWAGAGYVNNAEQWRELSPAEKAAYVQGLNDIANFVFVNDDLQTGIVKVARTRCLLEAKMAPNILSDVVTSAYEKMPQLRSQPPSIVYFARLSEICRAVINDERARFGLPPQ